MKLNRSIFLCAEQVKIKNGSVKQALAELNFEVLPPSPGPSSTKSVYIATDERSALNSIVTEMDKRELSRVL